jgi:hypothetical protein
MTENSLMNMSINIYKRGGDEELINWFEALSEDEQEELIEEWSDFLAAVIVEDRKQNRRKNEHSVS